MSYLEKMADVEMSEKEAALLNQCMRLFLRTWTAIIVAASINNFLVFISGFSAIELQLKLILIVFPDSLLTRVIPCFVIGPAFGIGTFWNGLALIIATHIVVSGGSLLNRLA